MITAGRNDEGLQPVQLHGLTTAILAGRPTESRSARTVETVDDAGWPRRGSLVRRQPQGIVVILGPSLGSPPGEGQGVSDPVR